MKSVACVGLDVHQETIRIAVLPEGSDSFVDEVTIQNRYEAVRKSVTRLSRHYELRCCYEASGAGYVLHRWLGELGISCSVIAPSKTPKRPGDRSKTDRRDAQNLARWFRAGDLTEVHIPSAEEEAVRSLVRCRETLGREVVKSKQYVLKFLSSRGLVYREGSNWTQKHWKWLRGLELVGPDQEVLDEYLALLEYKLGRLAGLDRRLEELSDSEAYQEGVGKLGCLRGIGVQTAMTLLTETIDFRRFGSPRQLMAYWGLIPSEWSSGDRSRHGPITKSGNSRCRRVLIEAAWHYRHKPAVGVALRNRQSGQPARVVAHALKAQHRLHKKFWGIAHRKEKQKAIVAVARELAGFIWAIMTDHGRLSSCEVATPVERVVETAVA